MRYHLLLLRLFHLFSASFAEHVNLLKEAAMLGLKLPGCVQ